MNKVKDYMKTTASSKISLAEMRKHIKNVVQNYDHKVQEMTGDNPQIIISRKNAEAILGFARAIDDALKGDLVTLRMFEKD